MERSSIPKPDSHEQSHARQREIHIEFEDSRQNLSKGCPSDKKSFESLSSWGGLGNEFISGPPSILFPVNFPLRDRQQRRQGQTVMLLRIRQISTKDVFFKFYQTTTGFLKSVPYSWEEKQTQYLGSSVKETSVQPNARLTYPGPHPTHQGQERTQVPRCLWSACCFSGEGLGLQRFVSNRSQGPTRLLNA